MESGRVALGMNGLSGDWCGGVGLGEREGMGGGGCGGVGVGGVGA